MRQERMNAYESFLEAWDECLRITQTSADAYSSDSADLEPLRVAAGRMAERARRIAILGPPIAARLAAEVQDATAEMDGRPIDNDAVSEATAEFQRRSRDVANLVASHREQGRDMRELDGHPMLHGLMESMQQYRRASGAARDALTENFERLSAASEQAFAMGDELIQNRKEHELSRERFTSAARTALSTPPPLATSTETRTENPGPRLRRVQRRNRSR